MTEIAGRPESSIRQAADVPDTARQLSASYLLKGDLSAPRLNTALAEVAKRHAFLRGPDRRPAPRWSEHDLAHLAEQARVLRLEVLAQREFARPFDPAADAPVRAMLIRTAAREHVLVLTCRTVSPPLAWDEASWRFLLGEIGRAYADPGGYARASRTSVIGSARHSPIPGAEDDAGPGHWRAVLADPPDPLEFPGPNGAGRPATAHAAVRSRELSADIVDRMGRLAADTGATPYIVMIAAVSALVARYTRTDHFLIAIALPVADRGAETFRSMGGLGQTGLLRARVSPHATFTNVLTQTRDDVARAPSSNGGGMSDAIVLENGLCRADGGTDSLARLSVGVREPQDDTFRPAGIVCDRMRLRGQRARRPLGVTLEIGEHGARVEAEYMVDVLDHILVDQMLGHLERLLESALRQPDTPLHALDMLHAGEAARLQRVSRGDVRQVAPSTLCEIVERRAAVNPDAVAVTYEGRHHTYREINERANRLAHWLIDRGIGAEDVVAVVLGRSPQLVVTALGIAKAGAVYLPVDPEYPADRIEFIFEDSAPKLVLRDGAEDHGVLGGYPTDNPGDTDRLRPLRPQNLAYVMYTSGSTGTPKAVSVSHAAVAQYFVWFAGEYPPCDAEAVLQVTSIGFDFSIEEIFGTLGRGARLVIPRRGGLRDIGYLTDLLRRECITTMHLSPSMLGLFLSLPGVWQWRTLRKIPVGGEPLSGELADKFHATFDTALLNFYGPTEATIASTRHRVTGTQGNRTVAIGTPKINTAVHLLDGMLRPVPVGVVGDIYIGGMSLARGYRGRPGLTAERFVADPYRTGGRLYRTGDLARRNADGDLEFAGRADEQVKVNGLRVELGAVAAAISVDPSVGQCVVVVREATAGRILVAYMTPSAGHETVDVGRVRTRVSAALPRYMTPAAYEVLDEIPITTHGKFDRDALPEPQFGAQDPLPGSAAAPDRDRLMDVAS